MAVSFVAASEDARNTANPPVLTPPSGTQAGDYLLGVQVSDKRGSLAAMTAPDASWSLLSSDSSRSDVGFVKIWRKIATASEPASYTWTDSTSAQSSAIIVALRGYDSSLPLSVTPTWSNGTSTSTHPAPSVAGAVDGMLVTVHVGGTNGTTRSYTAPSGMTRAQDSALSSGGYVVLGVYYQALATATATGSKIATCSASAPYVTMSLVVQQPSPITVSPSGISESTAFGSPTVNIADGDQTVTAVGLGSVAAFGSPTVSLPVSGPYPGPGLFPGSDLFPGLVPDVFDQLVSPATIDSVEAFGSPTVAVADGPQTVLALGIDTAEAFSIPTVTVDPIPPQTVETVGIFSGEEFGRPTFSLEIPVPTATGVDAYYIDGVALTNYAWVVETAEGLIETPVRVGDNVALPGRDGELQVFGELGQPRRADGPGRITFNMWLIGGDIDTGYVPSGSTTQKEWVDRWDELVRLLHRRRVVIDHARPDNTVRRAVGHLVPDETMTPNRSPGTPWFARFKATFVIPGAHWTDVNPITTGPLDLTTNGFLDLSAFAAATAPCTELQVVFHDGNNPRISTSTGFVGWNKVITTGRQLGIDTATGYTHQASGSAWVPGFDGLVYGPGPRVFEIDPSEPLQAIFTHTTGAGVPMTVEISGKRHYRTS